MKFIFNFLKATLVCLFFTLTIQINGQVLSGVYTIGGVTPDYVNLNSAVTDLNANGISGNVVFNIRTGVYEEQIRIYEFSTANYGDKVTFQSESGIREDVIIKHVHSGWPTSVNYTVFIDGADNIEFRHLTLQALPQSPTAQNYNRVIYVTNNSNGLVFDDNIIKSWETTGTYFEYNDCIFIGSDYNSSLYNDTILFRSNTIIGGNVGLNFQGSNSASDFVARNWTIENNIFYNQRESSLSLLIGTNTKIIKNKFYGARSQSAVKAIVINQHSDSLFIDGNYIYMNNGGNGITLSSIFSGSANFNQISNNSITLGKGNYYDPIGIQCNSNVDSLTIAHNSINILPSSYNGKCLSAVNANKLWIYNNHFVHQGGGVCVYITTVTPFNVTSNYNNYFNGSDSLSNVNGVLYNSVLDIFASTGIEQFSISEDPLFFNDTTLIPFNTLVYDYGVPVPSVPVDFYNNFRSTTAPDIGIYEGSIPLVDAGIIGSTFDHNQPCDGDSIALYAIFESYGTQSLTSLTITYQNNDSTISQASWNGILNQFEQDSVFLGYVTFSGFTPNSTRLISSFPNAQIDVLNQNDTLITSTAPSMSGTYSVGDSTSTFLTINEAVTSLINLGVCGPVILNVKSGSYNEQVIIPSISGASLSNTITIQSENQDSSTVTFSYNASNSLNNYTFQLDGANFIIIKHITLQATGFSYKCALLCKNGTSNNIFSHNKFISSVTGPNNNKMLVGITGVNNNYNKFEYNYFENGGYALYIGYYSASYQASKGNQIISNKFVGTYGNEIHFENIENIAFTKNETQNTADVKFKDCKGIILIEKNKILSNSSLILDGLYITGTETLIKNNFLTVSTRISRCSNLRFVNNSVNSTRCIYFGNQLTNIEVFNNAFNAPSGSSLNDVYYSYSPIDTTTLSSDYNLFYSDKPNGFIVNNSSYTFGNWKNLFGLDLNSAFSKPLYISNTNLHSNNCVAMNNSGISLADVTDDVDGEIKDLITPDIGADEFIIDSLTYHNIELFNAYVPDSTSCLLSDSVGISVINHSAFAIDSLTIKWWLFGNLQDSNLYFVNILPGDTVKINIQAFNFIPNTFYSMYFEISSPNGQLDNYFNDNDFYLSYFNLGSVEIFQQQSPQCNTDISLFIKNFPHDTILWSTGETNNIIIVNSPGTYSVTITDFRGCSVSDTIIVN